MTPKEKKLLIEFAEWIPTVTLSFGSQPSAKHALWIMFDGELKTTPELFDIYITWINKQK